jgi:hypothetical protein
MKRVQKPPQPIGDLHKLYRVFAAGTIDNGTAIDWQDKFADLLSPMSNFLVLNPRRDDWDWSWEQDIKNPQFREQVRWELKGMEVANVVASVLCDTGPHPHKGYLSKIKDTACRNRKGTGRY